MSLLLDVLSYGSELQSEYSPYLQSYQQVAHAKRMYSASMRDQSVKIGECIPPERLDPIPLGNIVSKSTYYHQVAVVVEHQKSTT